MPTSIVIERSKKKTFNHPAVFIYLITVCLACWVAGYMFSLGYPIEEGSGETPLWNWICRLLPGKLYAYIAGFLLMIGGAYLIQQANYALVLIKEKTSLPFYLFVFLLSTNLYFFPLKATSIAVFCMVLAIYQLFTSYHDPLSMGKAFRTSLIIGVGSLIWVHILWFVPLIWIGMYNFRSFTLRTFSASLVGLLTVYWFVFAWAAWRDDYTVFTESLQGLTRFDLIHFDLERWIDWVPLLFMAVLVVIASVHILNKDRQDSLRSRQFLMFLMLFAAWSFAFFVVYEQSSEEFIHIGTLAIASLTAHFFTTRRNKYTFGLFVFTLLLFPTLLFLQVWNFL